MKRFFAVVGIVAFLAACSDSNMTTPTTRLQPHAAARDAGDPPPPPLSGSGDGFLQAGSSGLAPQSATTNFPPNPCVSHGFALSYSFSYLGNNTSNNQVVHANLDGTGGVTGDVDVHQNENGKSNAHGHVADASFAFDIQSGDGTIDQFGGFHFTVSGILTNLATGDKCQLTGTLNGSLFED